MELDCFGKYDLQRGGNFYPPMPFLRTENVMAPEGLMRQNVPLSTHILMENPMCFTKILTTWYSTLIIDMGKLLQITISKDNLFTKVREAITKKVTLLRL